MAAARTIRDVRVTVMGREYTASYEVDGKVVEVWSAWGSRSGEVKAGDPKATAETLLKGLVGERV